jgi:hypothetical protein
MGNAVKWYKFTSEQDFDVWHDQIKESLDFPLPSIDIDGNVVGEPYTTQYTYAVKVSDNDWRAIVDEQYAEGLIESEEPTFEDGRYEENTVA